MAAALMQRVRFMAGYLKLLVEGCRLTVAPARPRRFGRRGTSALPGRDSDAVTSKVSRQGTRAQRRRKMKWNELI